MHAEYDKIIIGAGLYGLYAALFCGELGQRVLVLEYDDAPFLRASFVNQARVHMGYHYPRSFTTAKSSADYYNKFIADYNECINDTFEKIYAIAQNFSWTDARQFEKFCNAAQIPCKPIDKNEFFKEGMCESAYLTKETSFDAKILMELFINKIDALANVDIVYGARIGKILAAGNSYNVFENDVKYSAPFLLNATYASINQLIALAGHEPLKLKYELCEVILCRVSNKLADKGITVMDGPFFSLMPFGKSGLHSLTTVHHTPHKTSNSTMPVFECQKNSGDYCTPQKLGNCNSCPAKPESAWEYMSTLAKKYLVDDTEIEYVSSLFTVKTILQESEIDDSRPTVVKVHSTKPAFLSVLSGKINTVYDLNETLIQAYG